MKEPSPTQGPILDFMHAFLAREDRMPRTREIAEHFGCCQSNVMIHLRKMTSKGLLEFREVEGKNGWWRFPRNEEAFTEPRWTQVLPDSDGWWWHRHVVGSIPTDTPLNVILMTGQKVRSVYYRGQWRNITELPFGPQWQWSDRPIQEPSGSLFGLQSRNPKA